MVGVISIRVGSFEIHAGGFWGVIGTLVVLLLLLGALWLIVSSAVKGQMDTNLAQFNETIGRLSQMKDTIEGLDAGLGRLATSFKAEVKAEGSRSAVHALFGLAIGLAGGFAADWVSHGRHFLIDGIWFRGGLIVGGAVLLALALPRTVLLVVDWRLGKRG